MARNDGRTRTPDVFGKPGVSYPNGSLDYPLIVEERSAAQDSKFKKFLTRYSTAIGAFLIGQGSSKGDNTDAVFTERYETLPGPLLAKPGFNSELGMATTEYRQRVQLPASPDALGSVINGQVVVDSYVDPGESTVVGTRITECWDVPPGRTERLSIGYEFPSIFAFLGGWVIPAVHGFSLGGPFPGVNFTLTAHRTLSTPATRTLTYTNGAPSVSETVFVVTTPGVADRFFGIRANTIHNGIFLQENAIIGGIPASQTVENLPASTPSGYSPGSTLTIRVSSRLVKGTIWEKEVVTCSE